MEETKFQKKNDDTDSDKVEYQNQHKEYRQSSHSYDDYRYSFFDHTLKINKRKQKNLTINEQKTTVEGEKYQKTAINNRLIFRDQTE